MTIDKRFNRRDFLKMGAVTGAGAMLAACGGGAATQAPAAMPDLTSGNPLG